MSSSQKDRDVLEKIADRSPRFTSFFKTGLASDGKYYRRYSIGFGEFTLQEVPAPTEVGKKKR